MRGDRDDRMECGRCNRQLERMVVMNCQHHVCLECAARSFSMRRTKNQARYRIECEVCHETTVVEQSAANCLLGQLEDLTKQSTRKTRTSKNRSAASPGLSKVVQRDLLYCRDCQEPLGDVDHYLRSPHRQHDVQNIKSVEEIRQKMDEQLSTLTTKLKEKESVLGFLAEKKQIERSRVQMAFDKLRKAVQERQLMAYRQLEQLFSEEVSCLQKWLGKATEELFRLDLKLHEINELIKEKSLQTLFSLIKDKATLMTANTLIETLQTDENKISSLNRQLDIDLNSFCNFIRAVDKHRETLPNYSAAHPAAISMQEVTIRDLNGTNTPERGTARQAEADAVTRSRQHINTVLLNSPKVSSGRHQPALLFKTELKNARSNSSLGPSLLRLDRSTPIENLIKNLEQKMSKKSSRLNLFSPRNVQPADRIKRLFSPT